MSALYQTPSSPPENKPRISSVKGLLSEDRLSIPPYQRPYKWTVRHVTDLFSDLALHAHRSAYRLGTVVLHRHSQKNGDAAESAREEDHLDLVDGQQRTLTLLLAVKAMLACRSKWKNPGLNDALDDLQPRIEALSRAFCFPSLTSHDHLRQNFAAIKSIISRSDFTDALSLFLLNRCEVVIFTLTDISEAFQFFDSQNARGKDLDPHDLLKAYHLREFGPAHEQGDLMTRTIEKWESFESGQLAFFFGRHWFRIRNWSRGRSAREFVKEDTVVFKGVNLADAARYPGTQILRIAHAFTDHHRAQYERRVDGAEQPFPFQLDQTILNGRRFFEMTSHYLEMARSYTGEAILRPKESHPAPCFAASDLDKEATEILDVLGRYEGRHRKGDGYVRNLFDCLLLFYIDRFGMTQISKAIEKAFLWAYRVRLSHASVYLSSVDKHAIAHDSLFRVLRDAIHPADFLRKEVPVLKASEIGKSIRDIEELFEERGYLTNS